MRLISITSSPSPVTLDDVKRHLRIDGTDLDATLTPLIDAATDFVQAETRQQLSPATYRLYLDAWPDGREIRLPRLPLTSVASVRYRTGSAWATLADTRYAIDPAGSKPGRVTLNGDDTWPAHDDVANSIEVEFIAGYMDAANVPPMLKTCVAMVAGHYLEHPEAVIDRRLDEVPLAVRSILNLQTFVEAM